MSTAQANMSFAEKQRQDSIPSSIDTEASIESRSSLGIEKDLSNIVQWEDNDPDNPYNWSSGYKIWVTFQLGMLAFAASMGSSITSPAQSKLVEEFHISEEVAVLNVSLYILGFALGPLIWAPVSEIWGRRWSLLPAIFCLGICSVGTALSQNGPTMAFTRLLAGIFGSAPPSNVSAAIGDIYRPEKRGPAINFYACIVVGSPTLGPLVGNAILIHPGMGWRWTAGVLALWAIAVSILTTICLPEVYAPVLLSKRAASLRRTTGNPAFYHPHELTPLSPKLILTKHLSRPLKMIATEPTVLAIALYASFVYAIMYMCIEVYPYVYAHLRGWSPVPSSLPFLGLLVGIIAAIGINTANQPRYARLSALAGGRPVPEARFPPMIVGGILFATGLFVFAWTAEPGTHWFASVAAGPFIGAGFNCVFQQCTNALVDTYGLYSASAVGANIFLRSALAAAFPLLARPMFDRLGVDVGISILGAVAVLMIPVPVLLMLYGARLRKRSSFARELEEKRDEAGR